MGRGATRVAIYARVSTGEQSPELQLRELRDYAGRRGFPVHREYVDQASGDVRRAKLYYLRGRSGKSARIAERARDVAPAASAPAPVAAE